MSLLPEERSAEQTITGLAEEVEGLDYEEPYAFIRGLEIIQEMQHAFVIAIAARLEAERRVPLSLKFAASGLFPSEASA